MVTLKLRVDPERARDFAATIDAGRGTGIYVRAYDAAGKIGNADILTLDRESLDAWLRSRDSIEWPISVVMVLLDHGHAD